MPVNFNSLGEATYGVSVVSVDGAVPAPLVGRVVGQPCWRSDTLLDYQDCTPGTCTVDELTYPALTTATVLSSGANRTRAGGGLVAKWLGSAGVETSDIDVGPFAAGLLLDVDPLNGNTCIQDTYASGSGLTVYDDTGATVFALPTLLIGQNDFVRLRSNILSYQDDNGKWHLVNVTTGVTPSWYPRTDGINFQCPVTFGTTLYLIERNTTASGNQLTLRKADTPKGWVISSGLTFDPDAVAQTGYIRVGSCLDIGCTTTSLETFDCTLLTTGELQVVVGSVSGGAMVYAAPVNKPSQMFTVGAKEGGSLAQDIWPPAGHPVTTKKDGRDIVTPEWLNFFLALLGNLKQVGGVVQNTPTPAPSSDVAFTQIDSPGQPSLVASAGRTIETFDSGDSSISIALDPSTNKADLRTTGAGRGASGIGFPGQDGDDGPIGPPGPLGPVGPIGPTGAAGAAGGPMGPPGRDGDDGEDLIIPGPHGTNGTNGTNGAGALLGTQVITTTGAGTYTPTGGTAAVVIELQGAGGGGGGVSSPTGTNNSAARGGGGGGYVRVRLTTAFSGAGYVVGAKGTGGAAGNNAGTAGANTTFTATGGGGTVYTAGGGAAGTGGSGAAAPSVGGGVAAGGTATNGDINRPGDPGFTVMSLFFGQVIAGRGASSPYGAGGAAVSINTATNGTSAGNAATGKGAGGSGAVASGTGAAAAGGDGSDGMIVIWEYA